MTACSDIIGKKKSKAELGEEEGNIQRTRLKLKVILLFCT